MLTLKQEISCINIDGVKMSDAGTSVYLSSSGVLIGKNFVSRRRRKSESEIRNDKSIRILQIKTYLQRTLPDEDTLTTDWEWLNNCSAALYYCS